MIPQRLSSRHSSRYCRIDDWHPWIVITAILFLAAAIVASIALLSGCAPQPPASTGKVVMTNAPYARTTELPKTGHIAMAASVSSLAPVPPAMPVIPPKPVHPNVTWSNQPQTGLPAVTNVVGFYVEWGTQPGVYTNATWIAGGQSSNALVSTPYGVTYWIVEAVDSLGLQSAYTPMWVVTNWRATNVLTISAVSTNGTSYGLTSVTNPAGTAFFRGTGNGVGVLNLQSAPTLAGPWTNTGATATNPAGWIGCRLAVTTTNL